jgi:hypothetical protein
MLADELEEVRAVLRQWGHDKMNGEENEANQECRGDTMPAE